MKKSMPWRGMILLVVLACVTVLPANAVIQEIGEGETYQCWSFTQDTGQYGISPDPDTLNNPFAVPQGGPVAMIQNMSVGDLYWTNNYGYEGWRGDEFKIILDIPNQPVPNPYKILTLNVRYQGEISFIGATGIHVDGSMGLFDPYGISSEDVDGDFKIFTQQFYIEPNPQEEIVVIGFKSTQEVTGEPIMAALDQICIHTECVPEPATLSIFAIGAGLMLRRKHK